MAQPKWLEGLYRPKKGLHLVSSNPETAGFRPYFARLPGIIIDESYIDITINLPLESVR